jgi:hypothetical protein
MRHTFIVLLLLLSACNGTGPIYTHKEPESGKARIVVYRPDSSKFMLRSPSVDFNGIKACDLPNNSYFVREVEPKALTVSASFWDMPGTSRIVIDAKPNAAHFVRVSVDNDRFVAGMLGGVIAMGAVEATSSTSGPLRMENVERSKAETELNQMKRGCE